MRLTCPACGAVSSLDVLFAHPAASQAVLLALELPASLGRLLVQYVALFRPAQRQLSFDRLAKLLEELLALIKAGKVERHGRLWVAPHANWEAALTEMLRQRDAGKLRLPLSGHGYLLAILVGLADGTEGRAERAAEDSKAGRTPVAAAQTTAQPAYTPAPREPPRKGMPENIKQALTDFKRGIPAATEDEQNEQC